MSVQTQIDRIGGNVETALNALSSAGVAVGVGSDALPAAAAAVREGKALIAAAVTGKGVETAAADSFAAVAEKIGRIAAGPSVTGVMGTVVGNGSKTLSIPAAAGYQNIILVPASELSMSSMKKYCIVLCAVSTSELKEAICLTKPAAAGESRLRRALETMMTYTPEQGSLYVNVDEHVFHNPLTYRYFAWNE